MHNQPPPLVDDDLLARDPVLEQALQREGASRHRPRLAAFAQRLGSEEARQWGDDANRQPPRLRAFDRYGHRIDEVDYHPSYHALMTLATEHQVSSGPWSDPGEGAHVAHAAAIYLLS